MTETWLQQTTNSKLYIPCHLVPSLSVVFIKWHLQYPCSYSECRTQHWGPKWPSTLHVDMALSLPAMVNKDAY